MAKESSRGRKATALPQAPSKPEPELEDAFDRVVEEGAVRLARPLHILLATGLLGGIDVGMGVLAYFIVLRETRSHVLAGVAFSIGFVALLLGRSELFTENFMVPVAAVVAKRNGPWSLARLWGATLACNLVAGWAFTWLVIRAYPELADVARTTGEHYADLGVNLRSFCLALLAGAAITLMTRMQHGTDSLAVQIVPAVLFGALLAGGQLFHTVLDSLLMFSALHTGSAPFGYLDWLTALGWSGMGNIVGGIGLVTFLRLVRSPHRLAEERRRNK